MLKGIEAATTDRYKKSEPHDYRVVLFRSGLFTTLNPQYPAFTFP